MAEIKKINGVLVNVGPVGSTSHVRTDHGLWGSNRGAPWTFLEFEDGTMLKNVLMVPELHQYVLAKGAKELHIEAHRDLNTVIAVRQEGGHLYAKDYSSVSSSPLLVLMWAALGLALLPFFGLGLPVLWLAYDQNRLNRRYSAVKNYIKALPSPMLL